MLRGFGVSLLCVTGISAAVLPDQFGAFTKTARLPVEIADRGVWEEYGLEEAERVPYQAGNKQVDITGWRLRDTTGAFAATQWLQPDATQHGNYVLRINGGLPAAELKQLKEKLTKVDRAANPSLSRFLPAKGRIKGSERYLLGPASLAAFEPRLPSALAAFDKGAEGQLARYRTGNEETQFLVLSYPTPQIAAERLREFGKRPDLQAGRRGPLVAVALGATPEAASVLLGAVTYQPNITWSEPVPKNENPGDMILAICILAGALMALSVVLGLFFSGFRLIRGSRFGVHAIDQNFTSLHLDR